jgi:hypothetical protein
MPEPSPGLLRFAAAFRGRLQQLAEQRLATPSVRDPARGESAVELGPSDTLAFDSGKLSEEVTYLVQAADADPAHQEHVPSDADVAARLVDVEAVAAMTGRFDPDDLFGATEPEILKRRVLSSLAQGCDVEGTETGLRWLLLKDRRTLVLRRLASHPGLPHALARELPATDLFGEALREILRHGKAVSLHRRQLTSADDQERWLLALASAIEAVRLAGLPTPDPQAVQQASGQASFLREHRLLTQDGVLGRGAEEAALVDFITAPPVPTAARWEGLLLTGLGGAGKSTLLAKVVVEVARIGQATLAVLDFDRPGVDASDPSFLEREITRQVGYQEPSVAQGLRDRRRELRAFQPQRSSDSASVSSEERATRSLIAEMAQALLAAGRERPFLLVLDTFEEVTRQRALGRILSWLDELAEFLSPLPLKVIVSGRNMGLTGQADDGDDLSPSNPDVDRLGRVCAHSVILGELRPAAAERLLRNLQVPPAVARRLARSQVLPRRPLELKLLGRLLLEDPETDVDALEREVRSGSGRGKSLFAGIVSRRVLLRLRDPVARALASPGLILRYVTPDLIGSVLVPALGLTPLSREEAEAALQSLAAHGWLAYRAPNGAVWHRRDLRRSMLPAMLAEAPEEARRIHRAAVVYLEASSDERDRSEAFYHRLMLLRWEDGDTSWIEDLAPAVIRKAAEAFNLDLADLPPRGSALVQFARRPASVQPGEVWLLPDGYRERALEAVGERLVRARSFRNALALLTERDELEGGRVRARTLPRWETSTLFATASWRLLHDAAGQEVSPGAEWRPLREVLARCYPFDLISTGNASNAWVEDRLAALQPADLPPSAERARLLRELSVVLILRFPMGMLGPDAQEKVQQLLWAATRGERGLTLEPGHLPLAKLVGLPFEEAAVAYGPADLCLDTGWLGDASGFLRGWDPAGFARQAAEAIERTKSSSRRTVARMLAEVDALAKRRDNLSAIAESGAVKMWREDGRSLQRGPSPEFRDPVRYALADAFPNRGALAGIAPIVAKCLEGEWTDLWPQAFAERLADDPIVGLQTYVEAVDRSWNLGRLLAEACDLNPHAERLREVRIAFGRWDECMGHLLSSRKDRFFEA